MCDKEPCYICGKSLLDIDCFGGFYYPYHKFGFHTDICEECKKVVKIAEEQRKNLNIGD